jgi:metallo-beta-lactamase family protein
MKKIYIVILFILTFVSPAFSLISVISYGGAQTVSGSSFYIDRSSDSAIVDCGVFMNEREFFDKKNYEIPQNLINAKSLVLTHAHSDHIGRVPLLFAQGFNGKIYSTEATKDLSLFFFREGRGFELIKRKYFWFKNKNGKNNRVLHWRLECMDSSKTVEMVKTPMLLGQVQSVYKENFYLCNKCLDYEVKDMEKLFVVLPYNQRSEIFNDFYITLVDAKHVPGSASVLFEIDGKKILFSGDLGSGFSKFNGPSDPAPRADYIFMETTNGVNSFINDGGFEVFRKDLLKALDEKKIVWIPALSFNRTQRILYELKIMQDRGELDESIPIYSLSPSANKINAIYEREIKKGGGTWFVKDIYQQGDIFPKNLKTQMPKTFSSSMIVLSSSGDMDMGVSVRVFERLVPRKDVSIKIVNYVSPNSMAGQLLNKSNTRYKDLDIDIKKYSVFSGHADADGLLKWLSNEDKNVRIYLIHGQKDEIEKMEKFLSIRGWKNVKAAQIEKRIEIR